MKYVLITGGTSGIGYELARCFARNNYGIIIVSSNSERLEEKSRMLRNEFNTEVKTFQQDLSKVGAAMELYKKVKEENIDIDVLINNAGFGLVGASEKIDFDKDEKLMILNDMSLVELCKLFINDMYIKGEGRILNVSSTGAFQPGPYTSTYFASKAFVLSYSRALRYEAKKKGVSVCALCPGSTKTEFFNKEGMSTPSSAQTASFVAEYAYKKMMKNKEVIVPGLYNKLVSFVVPVKIKMRVLEKMKNVK